MYVSRGGSLVGVDILVDLFVQGQGHQSVSDRQPQGQGLLGDGGGLTASSAHVLLGIIEPLDRLPGGEEEATNMDLSHRLTQQHDHQSRKEFFNVVFSFDAEHINE